MEPVVHTPRHTYTRSITVYLPRELHRRVGGAAASAGTTRTAVMLEAVNRTHQLLGHVLYQQEPGGDRRDLFTVPQARSLAEPSTQTTLRVTDEQYAALEQLAAQHGVNRSKVMTTALRLHLDDFAPLQPAD